MLKFQCFHNFSNRKFFISYFFYQPNNMSIICMRQILYLFGYLFGYLSGCLDLVAHSILPLDEYADSGYASPIAHPTTDYGRNAQGILGYSLFPLQYYDSWHEPMHYGNTKNAWQTGHCSHQIPTSADIV